MKQEIIDRMNLLAAEGEPFLFVIDYEGDGAYIHKLSEINPQECLYDFEGVGNVGGMDVRPLPTPVEWQVDEPRYEDYEKSFAIVKSNLMAGNSYLTNLTCKVSVRCSLPPDDIFLHARGKYRLLLKMGKETGERKSIVCFSPETFVKIKGGRIYSYPMKGTLDATIPDAERVLMDDEKEAAEHATIVDLIRNDLSRVAADVRVDKYRYVDVLHTNKGDILQTSSEVSGLLPDDYRRNIGDILAAQLPAGSITGAPKDKTVAIISQAEGYKRGFYTGVMGIYDNGELNSAVMIRFIEQDQSGMYFKAGGGITWMSDCRKEYEEVIQKIYLPMG